MIKLKDIVKKYQIGDETVYALNGVTLEIDEHDFVAIIGASGSGKSTLMNIIGCLDAADTGEYYLDDIDILNCSDHDLGVIRNERIGFIFQQFNLLPKLSALENVELPMIYQGVPMSERKKRAMQALETVGLLERIKHRPNELSGGQQQRVAIARAIVANPTIILADEPTGNLDSKSSKDILKMLHQLHDKGNTIILITHDNDIAKEAARAIRIIDGKIVEDIRQEALRQ